VANTCLVARISGHLQLLILSSFLLISSASSSRPRTSCRPEHCILLFTSAPSLTVCETMGNVSGKLDDGPALFLRDQSRCMSLPRVLVLADLPPVSIAALVITNAQKRVLLRVAPNAFPSTKVVARKEPGDDSLVEFVQVLLCSVVLCSAVALLWLCYGSIMALLWLYYGSALPYSAMAMALLWLCYGSAMALLWLCSAMALLWLCPLFFLSNILSAQDPEPNAKNPILLKLTNEDELNFHFTFNIRRKEDLAETNINGLTFIIASNARDLENLVTREFHADPNLHKNPNVNLVGDFSTDGSSAVQFDWKWRWRPPQGAEERKNIGWRNTCNVRKWSCAWPRRPETDCCCSSLSSTINEPTNYPHWLSFPFGSRVWLSSAVIPCSLLIW
jgi:hypothetical protein